MSGKKSCRGGAGLLFSGEENSTRCPDMSPLQEELIARKKKLETVIKMARKDLANCPEGKLWVSSTHKAVQYYHHIIENDRVIHRYLPRDQAELKQSLAQKEYLMQLLKLAERELFGNSS